jgi:hypothetical protein
MVGLPLKGKKGIENVHLAFDAHHFSMPFL